MLILGHITNYNTKIILLWKKTTTPGCSCPLGGRVRHHHWSLAVANLASLEKAKY